ncbi:Phosphoribosylformimino-5-aminoimidazole carboxamide ribotide isomerase [Acidisarcina polymorpha]|uniref:Phosphoribosylformimino-5-aminoimidazole carboxamide ribotide isomerase n=1 Tax=Acidisarcina polymorpha TaxID=2211140 RepID=A0A2Z5G8S2_9BACT|nr:HisA/HisF-related TIM barrel protein [Acidisarcina polymorpha]AXC15368.1 Phosphoribosylformimino-5-aminoimidazole carboxamide ribotide isomerase [Acidisarcina polymorpha]
MLIPSIDLMGGRIVQLVQGEKLELAFDDFDYWVERFAEYPLVQLIDLDAAMRQGDNRGLIERISQRLPCQVGGGISSVQKALEVLQGGAKRVIVGSALFRSHADSASGQSSLVDTEFARALSHAVGEERIVCGIDTKRGKIAVKGWKEQVQLTPEDAINELEPYCGAFLYTHIDKEGTMQGFPFAVARNLRELTERQLIVAGGIREMAEIEALAAIQVDAVAGMAVYTGALPA